MSKFPCMNFDAEYEMCSSSVPFRKRRCHHNIGRMGFRPVRMNELIQVLNEKHGIQVEPKTVVNYEKIGLIPAGTRSNKGRGIGKDIDYPDTASTDFAASYRLKRKIKVRLEEVAKIREQAIQAAPPLLVPFFERLTDSIQIMAHTDVGAREWNEHAKGVIQATNEFVEASKYMREWINLKITALRELKPELKSVSDDEIEIGMLQNDSLRPFFQVPKRTEKIIIA